MGILRKHWIEIVIFTLVSLLIFFNLNNPFFWDKDILDSEQAHYFLQNNFNLVLPDSLDNGHIPVMGFILAVLWSYFGKSLIAGHLFMYLISVVVFFQIIILIKRLFPKFKRKWLILAILLAETSLLTQMVVVSNDLLLVCFFLISLNGILGDKRYIFLIGLTGLSLTGIRGILTTFALFIFTSYYHWPRIRDSRFSLKELFKIYWYFGISLLLPVLYIFFHYYIKGWGVMNTNGPWSQLYEMVDMKGFLRNGIIFSWRMLDAGRAFIWIVFIGLLSKSYKNDRWEIQRNTKIIGSLFLSLLIVYLPSSLFSKALIDNRYYIPLFLMFYLGVFSFINDINISGRLKNILYVLMFVSVLSGSFWVYPVRLSTCWSASLAHLPYFKAKDEMNRFIEKNGINRNDVKSFVPNVSKNKYVYLNDDDFRYEPANAKRDKYIFFSNVFNCNDETLDGLNVDYTKVKEIKRGQVIVILYKRKDM